MPVIHLLPIALRLLLLAVMAMVAGCATQREIIDEKPLAETRLFVTRAADRVNLSWQSERGMLYTVLYNRTHSARNRWSVLPGGESIPGNGLMISLTDQVPPQETRYYRLQTAPVVNRR